MVGGRVGVVWGGGKVRVCGKGGKIYIHNLHTIGELMIPGPPARLKCGGG